jgi:phage portal protein BeeE
MSATPSCIAVKLSPRTRRRARTCSTRARSRDQHPLLDLLARPNPPGRRCVFEALYVYLQLAGNAYVARSRSRCAQLYCLRPDRMRVLLARRLGGGL